MALFAHLLWGAFVGPFAQRCAMRRNQHERYFQVFLIHFDVTRVFSMPKLVKMHQNIKSLGRLMRGLNRGPFARQSNLLPIAPRGPGEIWHFRTSSEHRPPSWNSIFNILSVHTGRLWVLGLEPFSFWEPEGSRFESPTSIEKKKRWWYEIKW